MLRATGVLVLKHRLGFPNLSAKYFHMKVIGFAWRPLIRSTAQIATSI